MNIVYDYQIFVHQAYGGISRYFCELARQLDGRQGDRAKILAPLYINNLLATLPADKVLGFHIPAVPKTGKIVRGINHVAARWRLRGEPPDILHHTYYLEEVVTSYNGSRRVLTVYDMIHEKFREQFPLKDGTICRKRKAIERADHVICISENTKKDLLEYIDVNSDKVSVVHLGAQPTDGIPAAIEPLIKEPYILYVGERARYKNFVRLLKAYASRPYIHKNWSLICFGGSPFSAHELRLIEAQGQSAAVGCRHLAGDDATLANLYAHAYALIFPSLYEGFGIPALEAMSYGCPVVCSNGGALPEVAGEAAEYFDPYDADDIARALEAVLSSRERADALRRSGMERLKSFSWEGCARRTRDVYAALL